jgi:hypothetical protein
MMNAWKRSLRYRIGNWFITVGQLMLHEAEKRELTRRVTIRLRTLPKDANYERHAKYIAAEEMTKFYTEKRNEMEEGPDVIGRGHPRRTEKRT